MAIVCSFGALRFNGATTLESWKRLEIEVENIDTFGCFNGATTLESWKSVPTGLTRGG